MYWDKIKIKELIKMHKYYMHVHAGQDLCKHYVMQRLCV